MKISIIACSLGLLTMVAAQAAVIDLSKPIGSQTDVVNNLAFYYSFDSISGGNTVADGASPAHNGTLIQGNASQLPSSAGGVDAPGTSGYGNALYFKNGLASTTKQSYVAAATGTGSSAFNLVNTSFTIGAWLKMDALNPGVAQTFSLIDKQAGARSITYNGYSVDLSKDIGGNWTMSLNMTGGGVYYSAVSTTISNFGDGQWHEIAVVFNYSAGASTASFWFDGIQSAPASYTGSFANAVVGNNTTGLIVGQRLVASDVVGSQFDGRIDDLFIATSAYTFKAIPEPSSSLLLMGGLMLVLAGGYRRYSPKGR